MIQLKNGDKVAIVSLSNGTLGEPFCAHQLELAKQRLEGFGLEYVFMPHALKGIEFVRNHPEKRAEDLIAAFADPEIKGILCAIGGDETYRLAPYLFTEEAQRIIRSNPKFFMGYSDTTNNHLMLYKMGIPTYYGLSVLTCFAELGTEMLPYSNASFAHIFTDQPFTYKPSPIWYEERTQFDASQMGVSRVSHADYKGFVLLRGNPRFEGHLLGGCVESLYDILTGERYPEQKTICERYPYFPDAQQFAGAMIFLETSEEQPTPEKLRTMLRTLKTQGIFRNASGVLFAKPQNEAYYEEYKTVLLDEIDTHIPILYNLNFGHSYPKMLLQYGAHASVDAEAQLLQIQRL